MIENVNSLIELINQAGAVHWRFASAMFLQTVVLVAALCLFEACFHRRVRVVVRYWIWSLVLLKLLLPVTLRTPGSLAYWMVKETPAASMAASLPIASPASLEPWNAASPPPSDLTRPMRSPSAPRHPLPAPTTIARLTPENVAAAVPVHVPLASVSKFGWLLLAWLAAVTLLTVLVVRRAAKVWQLVRRATAAPPQLEGLLHTACRRLRSAPNRLRLRISEDVGCPAICGFCRPVILVPRRLVDQLDDEQFQLIFLHELSHWKRWDLQINLLQTLLQIVYFYNPAVWIANAVLRRLREEAVDDAVLGAEVSSQCYSITLLDVAAQSLRPLEASVRLIGILESKKALAQRIRRMASTRIPRSAHLGAWGFLAVMLVAIAFLPMAGRRISLAAQPITVASTTPSDPSPPERPRQNDASAKSSLPAGTRVANQASSDASTPLRGRITDENGVPVADARLQIFPKDGGRVYEANTDADGFYAFKTMKSAGDYQVNIFSTRCISLTDPDDHRIVRLDPAHSATRDFILKLGCQLRVQVVDEQGHPIRGVWFVISGRYDGQDHRTDRSGRVTIGGLIPSKTDYQFAAQHKDFVVASFNVNLSDPQTIVQRKLTLTKGVSIRGKVICSDGKPAAGCSILALPNSWNFMVSPNGQPIHDDGSFEFAHVGPGAYKIRVSIPQGNGMSVAPFAMSDVELLKERQPLTIKVDFPSPTSMGFIEGRIRYLGGRPNRDYWIHAYPIGSRFGAGQYVRASQDAFKLGPMPAGSYNISFDSHEIEPKELRSIATETKDLIVELHVRGTLALKGVLTASAGGPVLKNPRVRLVKIRTLRGPNYVLKRDWRVVDDSGGRFSFELPGPGVYVVEATADGYAIARSAPVDTDRQLHEDLRLKLSKGLQLSGTVIDEQGKPINGATVIALSKFGYPLPVSAAHLTPGAGVATVDGRFQFDDLNAGEETLHVVHPDYALAVLQDLELKADSKPLPLTIVMKRGGTVRGHVYDQFGNPSPGVHLHFEDRNAYSGPDWAEKGRFATVVTDDSGYYEVAHLPEDLVYVHREQEWESMGVVRQAVLPSTRRPATVDFGGSAKVTGQLLINGVPAANKKVLLSGNNAYFAVMKAYAMTDAEGRFVFRGIPAGERDLFVAGPDRIDDWIRIQPLQIIASGNDFGTINHAAVTLTVHWKSGDNSVPDDANVALRYYDPVFFGLQDAGTGIPRRGQHGPFVFQNLGIGKYALTSYRNGQLGVREVVEITGAQPEQSITLDSPTGTATLRGSVDMAQCGPGGCNGIQLRSKDNRWQGLLDVKPNGEFEFSGLPAGEYFLTQQAIVKADPLAVFTVADGETKSISVAGKIVGKRQLPTGHLQVRPYTANGLPLPGCRITLTGSQGVVPQHSSQNAQVSFVSEPGIYQLAVTYPGFKPLSKRVEVMPTSQDGRWNAQNHLLNLTLDPLP